jgi:hypothetical protein
MTPAQGEPNVSPKQQLLAVALHCHHAPLLKKPDDVVVRPS